MGRHRKAEKKKTPMLAALCIITALAVALSAGAVSLARYVLERREEGVATAAPFYFVSDRLSAVSADETPPHTQLIVPESGSEVEIAFTVSNHVDDLRRSEKDIKYTCTAYDAGGKEISCPITADGKPVSEDTHEITLGKSANGTDQNVALTVSKAKFEDGPVTVVATASSPYKKEIRGTFSFSNDLSGMQKAVYEENGAVVLEVIGDIGYEFVDITWPNDLIPDPSCVYLDEDEWDVDQEGRKVTLVGPFSGRLALTFLKTDPDRDHLISDFGVRVRK